MASQQQEAMKQTEDEEVDIVFIDTSALIPYVPAETPKERLKSIFRKNEHGGQSCEWYYAKFTAVMSFFTGSLYGSVNIHPTAVATFRKTHAHSIFLNTRDYRRQIVKYSVRRMIMAGLKSGFKASFMTTGVVLTAGCLAAWRDKAHVTDIGIGGAVTTGLYRINVGPKAMLAGAVLGGVWWQILGLASLAALKISGYSYDGFYKSLRSDFFEEEQRRVRYNHEIGRLARSEPDLSPWQLPDRWLELKLMEEQRQAQLKSR